jgi:uncharacterized protein (TIGR03435 family)
MVNYRRQMQIRREMTVRIAAFLAGSLLVMAPVFAQPPHQDPSPAAAEFDVASIRPAHFPSDEYFAGFASAGICNIARAQISGERVAFCRVTLCGLTRLAYDLKEYQIVGMPDWMAKSEQSIFYDIDTRAGSGITPTGDQAREMLRALLVDRFQLKVHRESRELPVYALIVGKNGPKFNEDREGPCPGNSKAGFRSGPGLFASCGPTTSMEQLAVALSRVTDRAVVDRTGLTGKYAFRLQWARDGAPVYGDSAPAIFTAVQEQLGLRLEPQRLPVEVLAIERAERPSPN